MLILVLEAVIILGVAGQGTTHIVGGDAGEYDLLGANLAAHGVFSVASAPPYAAYIARTPGYPAFLAVFYLVQMHALLLVRIAQFALLGATAWLVSAIASRVSTKRTAWISAVFSVTFMPLLWFGTQHMTEVLATFGVVLLVFLVVVARARSRPAPWSWAVVGLTLALLALVRPEFAGLIVPLAIAVLLSGRGSYRSLGRWIPSTAVVVAFVLALVPWAIRNESVAHKFIPLDAGAGVSLYASAQEYAGTFSYHPTSADWTRFYAQVFTFANYNTYFHDTHTQAALDSILTHQAAKIMGHVSPDAVLTNIPRRVVYMWGMSDFTPPGPLHTVFHRLALVQWILLVLLIGAGLAIRRRSLLRDWPLWLVAVYLTALHLVFHVESRYTIPARPVLFIYAAVAAGAIWDRLSLGREWRGPVATHRRRNAELAPGRHTP